jgi:hypothetical protein
MPVIFADCHRIAQPQRFLRNRSKFSRTGSRAAVLVLSESHASQVGFLI